MHATTRAIALFAALLPALAHASGPLVPHTQPDAAVERYGDLVVKDPYRWLEKADDPKVGQWSLEQQKRTRAYFDKLAFRKPMAERLMKYASANTPYYFDLHAAGGKVFATYNEPPKQQQMLAMMNASADPGSTRILVDPNTLNPKGTTAIDWFVPSHQGTLVAVSLSENGSEDGSLHIYDTASGKQVDSVIANVQYPTGGGSVAWRADGSGFWYTRYPGPDEGAERAHFFQQVWFHRLGDDPAKDRYVMGKEFPKIAEIRLRASRGSELVVVAVANGDGGEFAHYLLRQDHRYQQVTRFEDKVVDVVAGPDQALYLVSRKGSPRGRLLKLDAGDTDLSHARTIVPESEAVMQTASPGSSAPMIVTDQAIYLRELVGGPSRVALYGHDGKPKGLLPLPEVAAVFEIDAMDDGSVLYEVATYLEQSHFLRYTEATGTTAPTKLTHVSPVTFDDTEVVREFAVSRDGTRIPLNIVRRKGSKLDGKNPVLLTGYGGYGISMEPGFLGGSRRVWLDGGGIYVIANLRGGGEFGEEWHAQGSLTRKQNVFDDFAAVAQHLIDRKYTSSARLAAIGGSNGGLLMGAALTQHPGLFRAVVSDVGIYDMLRVELDPNGSFNVTEFGSVTQPDQLKALYAYSPYHRVTDGARYPAVLMATGANDGRVNPMHSRKMAARLQAATASRRPVLLSVNAETGHGIGTALSTRVGLQADTFSFLFDQLGMKYKE